jgi:hypothetical protein
LKAALDKINWTKLIKELIKLQETKYLDINKKGNIYLINSTEKGMLFWDSIAIDIMSSVD